MLQNFTCILKIYARVKRIKHSGYISRKNKRIYPHIYIYELFQKDLRHHKSEDYDYV